MLSTTSLLQQKGNADHCADQELSISGQVVTAPEPVGEPDRFVRLPGVGGLGGSPAPGAPHKSRRRGGGGRHFFSLVSSPNNSTRESRNGLKCANPFLLLGTCTHGSKRYRLVPCKRRDCEACGRVGRRRIAERIAYGVRQFWPCAWIVLTFAVADAESPVWKKQAVKRLGVFIRALRKELGVKLEYAATYECTARGRLHINLIIGPWSFIEQRWLCELLGA